MESDGWGGTRTCHGKDSAVASRHRAHRARSTHCTHSMKCTVHIVHTAHKAYTAHKTYPAHTSTQDIHTVHIRETCNAYTQHSRRMHSVYTAHSAHTTHNTHSAHATHSCAWDSVSLCSPSSCFNLNSQALGLQSKVPPHLNRSLFLDLGRVQDVSFIIIQSICLSVVFCAFILL